MGQFTDMMDRLFGKCIITVFHAGVPAFQGTPLEVATWVRKIGDTSGYAFKIDQTEAPTCTTIDEFLRRTEKSMGDIMGKTEHQVRGMDDKPAVYTMNKENVLYNFVMAEHDIFMRQDGTTMEQAWGLYKKYIKEWEPGLTIPMHQFRDELKNYFNDFLDRGDFDGSVTRSVYKGYVGRKSKPADPDFCGVHESKLVLIDNVKVCSFCSFVNKYYTMDPESDELLFDGSHLRNGMLVLIDNHEFRIDIDPKNLSGSPAARFYVLKYNRWCTVEQLVIGPANVSFTGVYQDGTKRKFSEPLTFAWLVKRISLEKINDDREWIRGMMMAVMSQGALSFDSGEEDEVEKFGDEYTNKFMEHFNLG